MVNAPSEKGPGAYVGWFLIQFLIGKQRKWIDGGLYRIFIDFKYNSYSQITQMERGGPVLYVDWFLIQFLIRTRHKCRDGGFDHILIEF